MHSRPLVLCMPRTTNPSFDLNWFDLHAVKGDTFLSVYNAAARRTCNGRKYDRISPSAARSALAAHASQNVLRSVWPFLCSAAATARHQNIWQEICSGQSTMTHGSAYDLRRVTNWSYGRPALQTEHNRRSSFRCRCTSSLERLSSRRYLCTVLIDLQKHSKTHLFRQSFT